MVYIVSLRADEVKRVGTDLRKHQRFTKALPARVGHARLGSRLALVLSYVGENLQEARDRTLVWIGVVQRVNAVGSVDKSITIDPLRECHEQVALDGQDGLLASLQDTHRQAFKDATVSSDVSH